MSDDARLSLIGVAVFARPSICSTMEVFPDSEPESLLVKRATSRGGAGRRACRKRDDHLSRRVSEKIVIGCLEDEIVPPDKCFPRRHPRRPAKSVL